MNDLAKIFPILVYELSGQHNIKDRLNRVEKYFEEAQEYTKEMPFDIASWIQPKMTTDLLKDIDESIYSIAKKISGKTKKEVLDKINKMSFGEDNKELDILLDEYFDKLKETLN